MNEDPAAIVIDNGSGMSRAGFAGRSSDGLCVKNARMQGIPTSGAMAPVKFGSHFLTVCSDMAQARRSTLALRYPVKHGLITDWDDMEKIWHHTFFDELSVNPEEHPIFLTDAPLNPKANREKTASIIFETFNAPHFFAAMQAPLALYSGRTTGVVVDVGDTVSYAVPVYEGFPVQHAIQKLELGGCDVAAQLTQTFVQRGHSSWVQTPAGQELVRDIKHRLGFVALDLERQLVTPLPPAERYELPDGRALEIGSERFRAPEVLFQPSILGLDTAAIQTATFNSIMKCDPELHSALYRGIVLCGGSSMFPGFADRMEKEITALAPNSLRVRVFAPPERKFSAWIGGSILACLDTFQERWISRAEYAEIGPRIVNQKCF
ncbi:Actin, cytoplasmic 1 [Mycena chlorophos]|uniref:Actin, cytoplasmic 1 n=1 Tax=Mycena chlorophos TaxID=658473 RepID=A0A8H6RZX7_MYCCL|nr:Actin, cytoplasmic 1 [Mycena chlorophos]